MLGDHIEILETVGDNLDNIGDQVEVLETVEDQVEVLETVEADNPMIPFLERVHDPQVGFLKKVCV